MALVFIKSLTADEDCELTFHHGVNDVVLDSTYNEYQFQFVNMHPATNQVDFTFQVNAVGGADFDETMTTTFFRAHHGESGGTGLAYDTRWDQGNEQLYQPLTYETGNDADQSCSGVLTLYAPSSTDFVKHFIARTHDYHHDDYSIDDYVAGYINTTSAIDEISFEFDSGNIDTGTIYMYGVG